MSSKYILCYGFLSYCMVYYSWASIFQNKIRFPSPLTSTKYILIQKCKQSGPEPNININQSRGRLAYKINLYLCQVTIIIISKHRIASLLNFLDYNLRGIYMYIYIYIYIYIITTIILLTFPRNYSDGFFCFSVSMVS